MSTPAAPGTSASTGVEVPGAQVGLKVTLPEAGTVQCALDCNGQRVQLRFSGGDVDVDVQPSS